MRNERALAASGRRLDRARSWPEWCRWPVKLLVFFLLLHAVSGCSGSAQVYEPEQLVLRVIDVPGSTSTRLVVFRVPGETLFHCPGVRLRQSGDSLDVSFVRDAIDGPGSRVDQAARPVSAWIESQKPPAELAEALRDTSKLDQVFTIPGPVARLYIVTSGKRVLAWESPRR